MAFAIIYNDNIPMNLILDRNFYLNTPFYNIIYLYD